MTGAISVGSGICVILKVWAAAEAAGQLGGTCVGDCVVESGKGGVVVVWWCPFWVDSSILVSCICNCTNSVSVLW